jgi:hypothetical protein
MMKKEKTLMNIAVRYKGLLVFSMIFVSVIIGAVCVNAAYAEREVLRGAAGGALKGAAVAELSDGDSDKGAAWGAAAGAARGVASKRRAEQEAVAADEAAAKDARIRELELQQAYEQGKKEAAGMKETSASGKVAR